MPDRVVQIDWLRSSSDAGRSLLVPFLFVVFVAAKGLAAFTNARFNRALVPLAPLIGGTPRSDGVHGLMTGSLQGRRVGVCVTTGTRSLEFEGDEEQKRNLFDIEIERASGGRNWSYGLDGLKVTGKARIADLLHVLMPTQAAADADEKALAGRLVDAGMVSAIERLGSAPGLPAPRSSR